ncbi:response regulator transcription factor [Lysobacter sp. ESA13C]|uniref:response regulator transcription factor n=1 Tax=Lysobacter sp. ESA13C TaxID=2862676 RepID=UPI0031BAC608
MTSSGQSLPRVALVEDDALLRERVLVPGLANFGFAVTGMDTAAALHLHLAAATFDIVVLDVGLPDADGFAVAREVREAFPGIGIVMLTGRGDTLDRVRGLSQGADAYLTKPAEVEVLAATLHSLARRLRGAAPVRRRWQLDADGWCLLSPSGSAVALTRTERRVVERLTAASGQLVTREQLVAALTDNVYDFDMHRLDSLVYRLRRKVADACGEPLPLNAVHGEGYVLGGAH